VAPRKREAVYKKRERLNSTEKNYFIVNKYGESSS
jgi:hypothetical protein